MATTKPKEVAISVRVSAEIAQQVDEAAARMAKANVGGLRPTRADVIRLALPLGLTALCADLPPADGAD